jgi:hypothetical protein
LGQYQPNFAKVDRPHISKGNENRQIPVTVNGLYKDSASEEKSFILCSFLKLHYEGSKLLKSGGIADAI